MSMHLGSWVSDLADGQLDAATTERALAHVAGCARCADELEAARAAHRALAGARDVTPDPELTARLLALSASIPPAAGDPLRGDGARSWRPDAPTGLPALTGDLRSRQRRQRVRRLVVAGAGGAGLLGIALLALGQVPVVTPDPSRTAALTALAAAGTAPMAGTTTVSTGAQGTTAGAVAWLDAHGWAAPSELPAGYEITALRVGEAADLEDTGDQAGDLDRGDLVVELDLSGPEGTIVVRQRQGRLAEPVADDASLSVPGHDVRVLSSEPWHVVWQAGDSAVDVSADVPVEVLTELVAAFPGGGYDAGVLPQLSRGWTTVTGALWRP